MRRPVKDSVPAVTDQTRLISFLAGHSSERNKRAETTMGSVCSRYVCFLTKDQRVFLGWLGVSFGRVRFDGCPRGYLFLVSGLSRMYWAHFSSSFLGNMGEYALKGVLY